MMEFFLPAYIDPNTGFQMFSSMGPLFSMFLALLGMLLWPLRKIIKLWLHLFGKRIALGIFVAVLIGAAAGAVFWMFQKETGKKNMKKVIVLGMDGLDPVIMEEMMAAGKLPQFQSLKEKGSYAHLQTVSPPQSPVAWSTFATGLNPGGHGLYDFLWRHVENYMPDLALAEFKKEKVKVLGIDTPMEKGVFVNRRQGDPFWKMTSEKGIPTTVIHCPVTFPAEKVSHAMLSGMGVPDIRGTQGTFTFYSPKQEDPKTQGGLRIQVGENQEGVIQTVLKGPVGKGFQSVEVPMKVEISRERQEVRIEIEGKAHVVKLGNWSPWVRVVFPLDPVSRIEGMTRFYLKALSPEFQLYASPFNFTPEKPVYPISYPHDYVKKLQRAIGDFHTLGMPHDTWALNEGAMDEEMFLQQADTIVQEEVRMLKEELPKFKNGLFVFVVETPDRVQHMFWRARDKKSPLYSPELEKKYGHVIPEEYQKMDKVLGEVIPYVDEDTLLLVISDHGFKSFRRAVNINSWLRDQGFLKLKDKASGGPFFQDVDWSQTSAFALGLGSIYINLRGREGKGIVSAEDSAAVKRSIQEKLKALKDADGSPVVRQVSRSEDVFEGKQIHEAPDLLVGFEDGYRASWQTALGAVPEPILEDNIKKWSGDHILDAELVPGIFFSNKEIRKKSPSLYDIAPTILSLFGIAKGEDQKGEPLF